MKKRCIWLCCLMMLLMWGMTPFAAVAEEDFSFAVPRKALDVGEKVSMSSFLTGTAVQWRSSDPAVATVDDKGILTGIHMGTATITATNARGQSAVCTITVGYYSGVDFSNHNGNIQWDQVKQQGIDFVMLRSSYGWYDPVADQNEPYDYQFDERFSVNVEGAKKAGLPFGLYHYSYAASVAEAHMEAEYMLNALKQAGVKPAEVRLPVVLDVEENSRNFPILDKLAAMGKTKATQVVLAFCEDMKKAGYTPMLYTSKAHFSYYFDVQALNKAGVHLWMAWWPDDPDFTKTVSIDGVEPAMWQYSETGELPGVSTAVDMDVLYMTVFRLHKTEPDPLPQPDPPFDGKGDVNGDGKITAADALQALQAATHKITLTEEDQIAADVDSDGNVSATDALTILQYATGKISSFGT